MTEPNKNEAPPARNGGQKGQTVKSTSSQERNDVTPEALLRQLKRVGNIVGFYPVVRRITRSFPAAVLLQNIFFWSDKGYAEGGWVYKSREEIERETTLSRTEQESARKHLREMGVLEEYHDRWAHRLYFRIVESKMSELLYLDYQMGADIARPEKGQNGAKNVKKPAFSRRQESCLRGGGNPAFAKAGNLPSFYGTVETTVDTYSKTPLPPAGGSVCADESNGPPPDDELPENVQRIDLFGIDEWEEQEQADDEAASAQYPPLEGVPSDTSLPPRLDAASTPRSSASPERGDAGQGKQVECHHAIPNASFRSTGRGIPKKAARDRSKTVRRVEKPQYSPEFEEFWKIYPCRLANGGKGSKMQAWRYFEGLDDEDRGKVMAGVKALRADYNAALRDAGVDPANPRYGSDDKRVFFPVKDAERFISHREFDTYADREAEKPDWIPAKEPFIRWYYKWDKALAEFHRQGADDKTIQDAKEYYDEEGNCPVFMRIEHEEHQTRLAMEALRDE